MSRYQLVVGIILSIDWTAIEKHIGYGREDAPVVFIGLEEGGDGDIDKLSRNLISRSLMPQLTEIKAESLNTVRTWRVACDFMLRRSGYRTTSLAQRLEYQRYSLGKSHGESLLTELMPYPSPGVDRWHYASLGKDPDRTSYFSRLLPHRITLLSEVINAHPREFVICYGNACAPHFKKLFPQEINWIRKGNIELAVWKNQRLAITPHFATRSFNTEKQMEILFNLLNEL